MADVEAILQLVDPLLVAGILLEQLLVLVHQIVVLLRNLTNISRI